MPRQVDDTLLGVPERTRTPTAARVQGGSTARAALAQGGLQSPNRQETGARGGNRLEHASPLKLEIGIRDLGGHLMAELLDQNVLRDGASGLPDDPLKPQGFGLPMDLMA